MSKRAPHARKKQQKELRHPKTKGKTNDLIPKVEKLPNQNPKLKQDQDRDHVQNPKQKQDQNPELPAETENLDPLNEAKAKLAKDETQHKPKNIA